MDPSIHQSRKFIGEGKMVKRGSPYLRWALMQAARQVTRFSDKFYAYYEKKLKEGKHYQVVLSHVEKNFCVSSFIF